MALSLERSKAAPLHLTVETSSSGQDPGCRHLMIPHAHKIETLEYLPEMTTEDLTQAFPNFPQSMPNLRLLKTAPSPSELDWDPSVDPFKPFPNSMRSLSLYHTPLYPSILKIRTLTELTLHYSRSSPPLDALLTILKKNHSLTSVNLCIHSREPTVHNPQRRMVAGDQLRHLSIISRNAMDAQALVAIISLPRGACLQIKLSGEVKGLNDILSGTSSTHLVNVLSPISMKYDPSGQSVHLFGPNGCLSFYSYPDNPVISSLELSPLLLSRIQNLWLKPSIPTMFHPPSFPALVTLHIMSSASVSTILSTLMSTPRSSPSLRALGFLDCELSEEFMLELARFAFDRKGTISGRIYRILIVHRDGKFPSAESVRRLRSVVNVVDVRVGK